MQDWNLLLRIRNYDRELADNFPVRLSDRFIHSVSTENAWCIPIRFSYFSGMRLFSFPFLSLRRIEVLTQSSRNEAPAENGSKFTNLQTINFKSNKIKDAGLKSLVDNGIKFPNLQIINLRYNKIADAGLKYVAENGFKFPKLQTINL